MLQQMKFKDSEIGKIPEAWEVKTYEEVAEYINGYPFSPRQWQTSGLPIIRIQNLNGSSEFNYYAGEIDPVYIIEKGDLLFSWSATVDAFLWGGPKAVLNQHIFKVLPKQNSDKIFLYYLIKHFLTRMESKVHGSTMKHFKKGELRRNYLPLPPLPEQRAIASILGTVDSAIQKVNEAIAGTERLKRGLMQRLLTKGIGHKRFKDSEIGKIPEKWEVVRLGDIAEVKGGKRLPKGHTLLDSSTPHPYVRVVDFENMGVNTNGLKYLSSETYEQIKRYTISSEDVYISIAGTIGSVGVIPHELDGANLTENAAKLCTLRGVDKIFLAYTLNSELAKPQINALMGKATQPKLALFRIEKIKIPIPPIPEQRAIASILGDVDKKLELQRKRKGKLERLKKGLMDELLTGRKRVKPA